MEVLVTGSAGFIAYHVCRRLLDNAHQVAGLDTMVRYGDMRPKERRHEMLSVSSRFRTHLADLTDMAATSRVLEVTPLTVYAATKLAADHTGHCHAHPWNQPMTTADERAGYFRLQPIFAVDVGRLSDEGACGRQRHQPCGAHPRRGARGDRNRRCKRSNRVASNPSQYPDAPRPDGSAAATIWRKQVRQRTFPRNAAIIERG